MGQICTALRKRGKKVMVAGIPCTGPAKEIEDEVKWNKETNKLLQEYVAGVKSDTLVFGPQLNGPKFSRDHTLCFDQVHFNTDGYKVAAKDTYVQLKGLMKTVEWDIFKMKLTGGS